MSTSEWGPRPNLPTEVWEWTAESAAREPSLVTVINTGTSAVGTIAVESPALGVAVAPDGGHV